VQPNSLLHYGGNIYSQAGDDGIIGEILRRLNISRGFFCEFGAWDGLYLSNTRLLFERGWPGLFIEADEVKFNALRDRYREYPDVKCVHSMVSSDDRGPGKTLDRICSEQGISHIDFLSIDIDGLDLNIFEKLKIKPTVVCIETGFGWHPDVCDRIPDDVAAANLGQPVPVMAAAAKAKGYQAVCFNQNLYLVDSKYATLFQEIDSDPTVLWFDAYYFMSQQFRDWLKEFRQSSPLVQQCERPLRPLP
jgi:hypothetical protein